MFRRRYRMQKHVFLRIVGTYQVVITTSPNESMDSEKKVYLP
ncbi:unnamed protein product [Rhodiola kirilowii]